MKSDDAVIFCDGASRGNPGPAAFGVVCFVGRADYSLKEFKAGEIKTLFTGSEILGIKTNNEAEYAGIIFALKKCAELSLNHPTVYSDSELVIRQLKGEYKVKNENLKPLFAEARSLADRVKPELVHVRREKNQIADYLANCALDQNGK